MKGILPTAGFMQWEIWDGTRGWIPRDVVSVTGIETPAQVMELQTLLEKVVSDCCQGGSPVRIPCTNLGGSETGNPLQCDFETFRVADLLQQRPKCVLVMPDGELLNEMDGAMSASSIIGRFVDFASSSIRLEVAEIKAVSAADWH